MAIGSRSQDTVGCQGLDLVIGETIRCGCPLVGIASFVRHAWNPRHPPHRALAAQDLLAELLEQVPADVRGFKQGAQRRDSAHVHVYSELQSLIVVAGTRRQFEFCQSVCPVPNGECSGERQDHSDAARQDAQPDVRSRPPCGAGLKRGQHVPERPHHRKILAIRRLGWWSPQGIAWCSKTRLRSLMDVWCSHHRSNSSV